MRILNWSLTMCFAASVAGCASHPLQDRVTRLELLDVVQKIRCEAADSVAALHPDNPDISRSQDLKLLDEQIGAATKQLRQQKASLVRKGFGTTQAQINEASDSIALQGIQIKEAGQLWLGRPNSAERTLRLDTLIAETKILKKKRKAINSAIEEKLALDKSADALAVLRKKRRDEFKEIIKFESQTVNLDFQFTITVNNDASSKGSMKWPVIWLPWTGSITVGYDVGDKKQRLSDRLVKITTTFGELYRLNCMNAPASDVSIVASRYPITGNIGLKEVIGSYIKVLNNGNSFTSDAKDSYKDKIEFTTTLNASVSPSITLTKLTGYEAKAEGSLGVSRKDVHTVTVFLKPGGSPSKTPQPQNVVITSLPTVQVRAHVSRQPPHFFNNGPPVSAPSGDAR